MRVGKLKNGKATGKDEITGKMIKGGGNRMVVGSAVIWPLKVVKVPEDCRSAVIVPLYNGKGERLNVITIERC